MHRVTRRKGARGLRRKNGVTVLMLPAGNCAGACHGGSAQLGGSSRVIEGIPVCTRAASVRAGGPRVSLGRRFWPRTYSRAPPSLFGDNVGAQMAAESASAPQRASGVGCHRPVRKACLGMPPTLARAGAVPLAAGALRRWQTQSGEKRRLRARRRRSRRARASDWLHESMSGAWSPSFARLWLSENEAA
jgi:hypothetical protein